MSSAPNTTFKTALIGAGPASLTLANILQNKSIPFVLYEAAKGYRNQGGSLDLHPQAGQLALKEAGLWDQFVKYSRPESDVLKLVDVSGEVLWDENTTDKQDISEEAKFEGRPEIDRARLMQILHENLNEGSVKFDKKLKEVVPNANKYDLHFADGTQETDFDLVVGGDGAWSKVRTLLTDAKPRYSGITGIEVWCNDIGSNPWLLEYIGAGSLFAFGQDCAIQSQRQGDGSLRSMASLRVPEDFERSCGINWDDKDAAREEYMARYFSHVAPDLRRIIAESTDYLAPRAFYELPVGLTWPSRSGVTLIGDAAHLMTPFAGVGVNVGMADALGLAQEIIAAANGEKSLDGALRAYEVEMFPRAKKNAEKTERNKGKHFMEGGSREMADMLKAHFYGEKGSKGSAHAE